LKVTVEKPTSIKRLLYIEEDSSIIDKEEKKILKYLSKNRSFPGFRPGKIPIKVLKKIIGSNLDEDSLNSAISILSEKAIEEEKLTPISEYKEKDVKIDNNVLSFVISFEILPVFELLPIDEISVEKKIYTSNENLLDKRLELYQERSSFLQNLDRVSKISDYLQITMETKDENNNLIKEYSYKDKLIQILDPSFPKNLSDNLVDLKEGDNKEFTIDLNISKEIEKKVNISVLIHKVKEKIKPELNNSFAKDYGFESIDKLKKKIEENLENELKQKTDQEFNNNILIALENKYSLEIPETLIKEETDRLYEFFNHKLKIDKNPDTLKGDLEEIAKKKVKQNLILDKIAEKYEVKVENKELNDALIESMAQKFGYENLNKGKIKKLSQDRAFVRNIYLSLAREKALNKLKEEIQIKEVKANAED